MRVFALVTVCILSSAVGLAQVPRAVLDADLVYAARSGDVDLVKDLLEKGADANARDEFDQPAILLAGRNTYDDAHLKIIDLLLDHGADIAAANRYGTTALMITQTTSRHFNWDSFFRKRGADFGKMDIFGGNYESYPLFGASETFPPIVPPEERKVIAERDIVWRLLLEGGLAKLEDAKCCGTLDDGITVTMALAYYDYEYLFENAVRKSESLLLEKDGSGKTAMHYASLGGCASCIFLGFPGGLALDVPDKDGRSPIILAAIRGHDQFIYRLLRLGARPDFRDRSGNTALGYAAAYGRHIAVMALISGGADASVPVFEGAPALVAAVKAGQEKVVAIIASLKAAARLGLEKKDLERNEAERFRKIALIDADQRDSKGWTALMHAASSGAVTTAEFLLAAGADPLLKDRDGRTAGDIAGDSCHPEFVRFLEKAKEGGTP